MKKLYIVTAIVIACALLYFICHKHNGFFEMYELSASDVTSIRLISHMEAGDCTIELSRENALFELLIEFLDCRYEKLSVETDNLVMDPMSVELLTAEKAIYLQPVTLETSVRTEEMICVLKDGALYHLFNETASLRKLYGIANYELVLSSSNYIVNANASKAPLVAAYKFLDPVVFTDTVIYSGDIDWWQSCGYGVLTGVGRNTYDEITDFGQVYAQSELVVCGRIVSIEENSLRPLYNPLLREDSQRGSSSGLMSDLYDDVTLEISEIVKGKAEDICLITVPGYYTSQRIGNISVAQRRIAPEDELLLCLVRTDEMVVGGEYDLANMYFGILLKSGDSLIPLFNPAPELEEYYPHTLEEVRSFI